MTHHAIDKKNRNISCVDGNFKINSYYIQNLIHQGKLTYNKVSIIKAHKIMNVFSNHENSQPKKSTINSIIVCSTTKKRIFFCYFFS